MDLTLAESIPEATLVSNDDDMFQLLTFKFAASKRRDSFCSTWQALVFHVFALFMDIDWPIITNKIYLEHAQIQRKGDKVVLIVAGHL